MLEGTQKRTFLLIYEKNNPKLSTPVAFISMAHIWHIYIYMAHISKKVCLFDISWLSCQCFCLTPAFLLACIAINCQVMGCKRRSLFCSLISKLEDANIRFLTLNWQTHVTVSPILKHSPSNLQVLVSQRKRSFSLSS